MNLGESDKPCARFLPWLLEEVRNHRGLPDSKFFSHVVSLPWNPMTGPGISVLAKAKQRWPKSRRLPSRLCWTSRPLLMGNTKPHVIHATAELHSPCQVG